jgi:hypothetical protein
VALTFAALIPTTLCFMQGQDVILILSLTLLSLNFVLDGRDELAGFLLAMSLFKPQSGLAVALAMIINRRWRFTAGFTVGCVAIILSSLLVFSPTIFFDLLHLIARTQDPDISRSMVVKPETYPTLRGLFYLLHLPQSGSLLLSLLLLAPAAIFWRRADSVRLIFGSALLFGCLTAFNWHMYDLVLLMPVILLFGEVSMPMKLGSRLILSPATLVLSYFNAIPLLCLPMLLLCAEMIPSMWPKARKAARA